MGTQLADLISAWKNSPETSTRGNVLEELEWFVAQHQKRLDALGAFFLRDQNTVHGFGFFLLQNRPLMGYLGEIKIFSIPIHCVRFVEPPCFPDQAEGFDLLLASLDKFSSADGIFIRSLPLDSFLWNYLKTSPAVSRRFQLYLPKERSQHFVVKLPATFEEYLQKFSSKSRSNLRRSARKLQKDTGSEVRLARITSPEQVDSFVDTAVEISKKTYQWRLAGSGLRETEVLKQSFRFLAERGWLRCYLLWCGEEACAFMICNQRNGICRSPTIGYDPRWEKYSVGTTLQFLVIEDLFVYDRPDIFDFGTGAGGQKEFFGNTFFFDTDIYILKRGVYARLASGVHKAGSILATSAKRVMEHFDLKRRIKKFIRKASVAGAAKEESKPGEKNL